MYSQQPCTIDYEKRIKYVILWVSDSVIGAKPLDRIKKCLSFLFIFIRFHAVAAIMALIVDDALPWSSY